MRKFNTYRRCLLLLLSLAVGLTVVKAQTNEKKAPIVQSPTAPSKTLVKVRVVDITTGTPIDSAKVSAYKESAYTNAAGICEISGVTTGTEVQVKAPGYITQRKKVKESLLFRLVRENAGDITEGGRKINVGLFARDHELYTGAYTQLSGDDLRRVSPSDILTAIAVLEPSFQSVRNNVNGDDPNTLPSVQITGSGNFPSSASIATSAKTLSTGVQLSPSSADFIAAQVTNANMPLILLNGTQISLQQLVDMDINRIDKIVVLKDAVATATYGSRGANGALSVQTYPVRKGIINLTYTGVVQATTADVSSYNLLDAASKLNLEQRAHFYDGMQSLYQQRLSRVNNGLNTDWVKLPLQTGVSTRNSIAADGGDENLEYGLNVMYNNTEGTMKGSGRQNTALELHLGARVKSFVFKNTLRYAYMKSTQSPYGNLSDYAKLNAYWTPYDSVSGSYAKVLDQYHVTTATGGDSVVTIYNPAYNTTLATQNITTYNLLQNVTDLNWQLRNGFSLSAYFSIIHQNDQNDMFLPPDHTVFAGYPPNLFFQRGLYTQTTNAFTSLEGKLQLSYTKRFGLHSIDANAGISALSTSSNSTGLSVQGFTSSQLANISFGSGYSNTKPATGIVENRWAAAYGAVNYSYDSRYQLDLEVTGDGSSQFSNDHRYVLNWATGASWNITNEHFIRPGKVVNQLRLKASTGVTGNIFYQSYLNNNTYNYFTNQQYVLGGSGTSTRGIGLGAYLSGVGNTSLESPENKKTSVGFDAVLLANRISVSGNWYWQTSSNLVLPITSPIYTGYTGFNYYDNLGGMKNSGLQLSLQYALIQNNKKSIYWTVMANTYHNVNTVTATSSYIDSLNANNNSFATDQTKPQPLYIKGQSLDAIWAVQSAGIDPATGQEKFIKADGTTTNTWSAADKKVMGHILPTWQGSLGTSFTIKQISFSTYFNYQLGAKAYNSTLADKVENANLVDNVDERAASGRWNKAGDVTPFKALSVNGLLTNPTYATSRFIENNDWINCASMAVSYRWPSFANKKIPLQNTVISFTANNLFRAGGADMERGIYYPFNHMYSFKLTTSIK